MCEKNTLALSVDNKNKVEVGIPATNRRSKIRTFYMIKESPNYNDHDFPHSNAKLVPAGYQILRNKITRSRSLSPKRKFPSLRKRSLSEVSGIKQKLKRRLEFCQDKIGRSKIKWPRSGPLNVKLCLSRLIGSTNVLHVHHLMQLIRREKEIKNVYNVVAIADGGPDWSIKGLINFMSLGLLWMKSGLDFINRSIICTSGHSRFNPI